MYYKEGTPEMYDKKGAYDKEGSYGKKGSFEKKDYEGGSFDKKDYENGSKKDMYRKDEGERDFGKDFGKESFGTAWMMYKEEFELDAHNPLYAPQFGRLFDAELHYHQSLKNGTNKTA